MYDQIASYLATEEIVSSHQFGFRKKHSCSHALLKLIGEVEDNKRNKQSICGVFCDLSKAFDTLSHTILLEKLKTIGFTKSAIKLLASYLAEREQIVNYDQVTSRAARRGNHGVPQGSILGPLLFNIYVNDIQNCTEMKTLLFADDTVLLCKAKTNNLLQDLANKEFEALAGWFSDNHLVLNAEKTNCLNFTKGSISIKIGTAQLENIEANCSIRYLGFDIDRKLAWNSHVTKVRNKIKSVKGMRARVKCQLPTKSKLLIYNALIGCHLNYGAMIWMPCLGKVKIKELQTLQNQCIRIVAGAKYFSHVDPLYKKFGILKVEDIVIMQQVVFAKSLESGTGPATFHNDFIIREVRTIVNPVNMMVQSKLKSRVYEHLTATWNAFSQVIKDSTNKTLKNKLKCDLLKKYKDVQYVV